MNKTQITLAAIGGVALLAALVLGYFIWDASSVKSEKSEALESGLDVARTIMRKLPVRPEKSALAVYDEKAASYADWRTEARKVASRGDLPERPTTPAEFKTLIVDEARDLARRPGAFDGKFTKGDCGFGFRDYILGGAMPPEADLKRLTREWYDVAFALETIAVCGSNDVGLVDVRLGAAPNAAVAAASQRAADAKSKKNKKKSKSRANAKAAAKTDEPAAASGETVTRFAVDFVTRPAELVRIVNAFATAERFTVVENFSFTREQDVIAEKLGADASKRAEAAPRNRRRARGAVEESRGESGGVIIDPANAPLLKATLQLAVYDFGSLKD